MKSKTKEQATGALARRFFDDKVMMRSRSSRRWAHAAARIQQIRESHMQKALLTWRLTPIGKDSDLWNFSSHSGEVWVRAHDALEARALAADRFRVRSRTKHGRSGLESPWYVRELARCERDQDGRFETTQTPCVVYPALADAAIDQTQAETPALNTPAHVQPAPSASDVREAIVALLLAKRMDVPGRWLDVYMAPGADDAAAYVIIPARKLKGAIAEELSGLIGRTLSVEEKSWLLGSEEIRRILRSSEARLSAS
jgi:hypothetical protein